MVADELGPYDIRYTADTVMRSVMAQAMMGHDQLDMGSIVNDMGGGERGHLGREDYVRDAIVVYTNNPKGYR